MEGFTHPHWDEWPEPKARAEQLVAAFNAAGMHLQCERGVWSVRIEGEFMDELCTLYEASDTEDKAIERYVWQGVGDAQRIVAEYVRDVDDIGY